MGSRLNRSARARQRSAAQNLRRALFALLTNPENQAALSPLLCPAADCHMDLPATIGDYTDFYAGIHHAMAVGSILRPDNPLPTNYKYVPIGYHGRASSIRASGAPVRRPSGQVKEAGESAPRFTPTHRLDFELELGIWIGAPIAARRADPNSSCVRAYCRLLSAQRLVGARHPGLGISAARTFPRQEFPDEHFPLDRHGGSAGAISRGSASAAGRRSAAASLSLRSRRPGRGRAGHHARRADSHCVDARAGRRHRNKSAARTPRIFTGRRRSSWRIILAAAAISMPAISWAQALFPAPTRMRAAASWK